MPSIFGHSAVGVTASYVFKKKFAETNFKKFLILSVLAANLPDIDIFFHQSPLGHIEAFTHRSFFHSILFAILAGISLSVIFYSKSTWRVRLELSFYFFLVTMSHNFLDALTKGFGVAFFHPFDKTQYNLPITPLNPAGWSISEFSANRALGRESLIVWIPMLFFCLIIYFKRKKNNISS